MWQGGVLEVHGNVVFEANTAGDDGGAVSLPIRHYFLLHIVVVCNRFCEVSSDLLCRLTQPLWKG